MAAMSGTPAAREKRMVDLVPQALKLLAERHPFDADEPGQAPRDSALPALCAAVLARGPDGRRKHRRPHHEPHTPGPGRPPKPPTVWERNEEFFRPINLSDIELLIPKMPFGPKPLDPSLCVPVLGSQSQNHKQERSLDEVKEVNLNSKLAAIAEEDGGTEKEMKEEEEKDLVASGSVASLIQEVVKEEAEVEDSLALNWLLGSRQRCVLTSERPNKKRKLLGGDAGLDRLLQLPHLGEETLCDVCCLEEYDAKLNGIVSCGSCKVAVHRKCYGLHGTPDGPWLCSWCKHLEETGKSSKDDEGHCTRPCVLCPKAGGALKLVGGDGSASEEVRRFAHLFCSVWAPEVFVEDTGSMEPVLNVGAVPEMRTRLVCYLCKVKHGVCVRCSHGTCRTSFHPICARDAKHQMEIWGKPGCDNVELRAFCIKHSAFKDKVVSQNSEKFAKAVDNCSSAARPLSTCLPTNILLKLRLSRNNKDKSLKQDETPSLISDDMVKNGKTSEQDALHLGSRTGGEAQMKKNKDIDGDSLSTNCNLIQAFRKLMNRGKYNVDDVASRMGISCNSLEALLSGDMTSFSVELKPKIIQWIEDSVHLPVPKLHLNLRSGSAMASGSLESRSDGPNVAQVTCGQEAEFSVADGHLEPLSVQRRTKGNMRILSEDKTPFSSREMVLENDNGRLIDDNAEVPAVISEDMEGDPMGSASHDHDRDCCQMVEDTSNRDSTPSIDAPPEDKGNPDKQENNIMPMVVHQPRPSGEGISSSDSGREVDDAYTAVHDDAFKKGSLVHPDDDISVAFSAAPDLKHGESCCSSSVHPFIKKRLIQVQKHLFPEQQNREAKSNGNSEMDLAAYAHTCSHHQALHFMDLGSARDAAKPDQFDIVRNTGILELSPEDEIEGEMLYLQNRLLDNALAIKRSCEGLICRVVRSLPQELDALKKKRWDLVLVSQFLRELREAKKRGRKERKHREAQAVLAAAAAAAASSSRISSVRKDANDECISADQESPLKVSTVSGRAALYSPLLPRLKEALSRSAVVKVPQDKLAGTFQIPDLSKESTLSCDICRRGETVLNRIFVCSSCKVAVHLDCYRRFKDPIGSWKCELCEEMSFQSVSPRTQNPDCRETSSFVAQCGLCGGISGAFRKTTDGQWVHAFCAEWFLESTFKRGQHNLVEGMESISKEKDLISCSICHWKCGVCLKCSYGHCQIAFHLSCARSTGLYMNVKSIGGRLQHKAYCARHSMEQREADIKQHGAEELKSMKQIRVELEKLRLLCERIIKREKVKRELVFCSHEIHASRRDCVAFSALVRSSFFPPGGSSESATTSIDEKSYSGIQRSDDGTVDSAVCSNRTGRLPVHMDVDRRTDDSSTSQLSSKRKLDDRATFSGKQIPHRSGSIAFRSSADDIEKRSKVRKHTETFQKELVMTSVQASIQNRRLPKGFVYVPVGYISEEKPATGDSKSHEVREPGG